MEHVRRKQKKRVVSVDEIVKKQELPRALLRRILQVMARQHIITSRKGKGGGFVLQKNAADVTVSDLLELFHTSVGNDPCFVRDRKCPAIRTCKLRQKVAAINEKVFEELNAITIASLL